MAERAFQQQIIRFGAGGLSLRPAKDVVPPNQFPLYSNALRLRSGQVTGRPGLTLLSDPPAAHTNLHSIGRLNDTQTNTFIRVWGIDTDLYYGVTGVLTLAETGFSGDPLTMVAADPPIPGDPWMYIADSLKMRKIRGDGLDLEIGLPKGVLISATPVNATFRNDIDDFEAADYNVFAGDGGGNAPTQALIAGMVGNAVEFTTDPGAAAGEYSSFADKAVALDLSQYIDGAVTTPATDADPVHFWARTTGVDQGVFWLVLISGTFTSGQLPGTGTNLNYFLYPIQTLTVGVWKEFGVPGAMVTRGDFVKFGNPDWANITGISIVMSNTAPSSSSQALDDWYMTPSGSGLGPVNPPYDYRVTNYDPRTGVEGNGSTIQPEANWISDPLDAVQLIPEAYGDADIRQRFYRRGNTLPGNWFFVGENTSNGGTFYDTASDAAIAAGPTVPLNHDQPITSIDDDGNALLNQPVPILFGPVQDFFYAVGDPRRPNMVYQSIAGQPDYWPADTVFPACAAGEELVTGCVWGGEGYVASRSRWFRMIPGLSDARQTLIQPSGATKGVITRWAMTVGPDGIHFLSDDGWYVHRGGVQENLTDDDIYPLFNGETADDTPPIDFSEITALRMGTVLNEVWLVFVDTEGSRRCLVLDTLARPGENRWRFVDFAQAPSVVVGEIEPGDNPPKLLLVGGAENATGYTHTGTSDAGTPIAVQIRTACLNQDAPRQPKQYGDLGVQFNPRGVQVTVEVRVNLDQTALPIVNLPTLGIPQLAFINPFGDTPTEGLNLSLEFVWETDQPPPLLDFVSIAHLFQPGATAQEITDWDDLSTQTEKYFKGCVIDCDTGGVEKTVIVEGTLYGGAVTTIATLTINANGRRKLTFTWPRTAATLIRLRPVDPETWTRWAWQWIADEEPLALSRWETEPLDFALPGWKTVPQMFVTLRSTAVVTLTVTAFRDNGTSVVEVYTIPSTGGVKQHCYLPLRAGMGTLYSFVFTIAGNIPWRLYREETTVFVKPIAGAFQIRHPFGNDDLDLVRGLQTAEGTAAAPGGGQG